MYTYIFKFGAVLIVCMSLHILTVVVIYHSGFFLVPHETINLNHLVFLLFLSCDLSDL